MKPVISLTTIPSRIEHITPCLTSLLSQGLPVYLWVPAVCTRTGDKLKRIPPLIEDIGAIINIVDDMGPITKLLPALKAGHQHIITADDDHIYGKGWAKGLMKWAKRLPGSVVCYRGRIFGKDRTYKKSRAITRVHRLADMVTTISGVFYDSRFFSKSIFEEWKEWPMNDDIVVSGHLRQHDIPIEVVPFPKGAGLKRLHCMHTQPLYKINPSINDEGLAKLFWSKPDAN